MPAQSKKHWAAREVRRLIADAPLATPRYELVDGELLVTPSPAFRHQAAVADLLVLLALYLERQGIGAVVGSPADVELEPEDVRQPDLFVIPRMERRRVLDEGNPIRRLLLAVEVLSPSSARYDRVLKRPGYQRHVAEYWIVDTDARLIERWLPAADKPEVLTRQLEWLPQGATEALTIDVAAYFARVLDDQAAS